MKANKKKKAVEKELRVNVLYVLWRRTYTAGTEQMKKKLEIKRKKL